MARQRAERSACGPLCFFLSVVCLSAAMSSLSSKHDLRHAACEKRMALADPGFAATSADHAHELGIAKDAVVGAYHALPDEADPALLLQALVALGAPIAFPRVAGKGMPLEYHRVPDGEVLATGAYGIH